MNSPPGEIIGLEEGWQALYEEGILRLQEALEEELVLKRKLFSNQDYSQIYTKSYQMCTQRSPYNWSEQLYFRHGKAIKEYLQLSVLPSIEEQRGEHLLREVCRRWSNHLIFNKWMGKFFMYLDRFYVKYNSVPLLADAGLALFKDEVFESAKSAVIDAALTLIDEDRGGSEVNRDLIKETVDLYLAMGHGERDVFERDFEGPLLQNAKEYYGQVSASWVCDHSSSDYLRRAEEELELEDQRASCFLPSGSKSRLLEVVVEEMLEQHHLQLIEDEASGCEVLLLNDCREDLRRMTALFSLVRKGEGLAPLAEALKRHIQLLGERVIGEREDRVRREEKASSHDPVFIRGLLDLHDHLLQLIEETFLAKPVFHKALKDAFALLVNKDVGGVKNAELVASYLDRVLRRGGGERLSDEEAEAELSRVVGLFTYLVEKDFFSEVYRVQLAKRLLMQQSLSEDLEKAMVGKLKLKCGAHFTGKLEGMLNDFSLTPHTQAAFDAHRAQAGLAMTTSEEEGEEEGEELDFSVRVLTTGYWPSYPSFEFRLPLSMQRAVDSFTAFFATPESNKLLTWKLGLGTASVVMRTAGMTYHLQLATPQAILLLLCFNEAAPSLQGRQMQEEEEEEEEAKGRSGTGSGTGSEPTVWVPFEHVAQTCNMTPEIAKRVLHSLLKARILRRRDGRSSSSSGEKPKGLQPSDLFSTNPTFSSSKRKISIPMASLDESSANSGRRVEEDRSVAIEACIVRIMKARKQLSHPELINEVLLQLSFFQPNPKLIKKRIEALMDREYIKRSEGDSNMYEYIA